MAWLNETEYNSNTKKNTRDFKKKIHCGVKSRVQGVMTIDMQRCEYKVQKNHNHPENTRCVGNPFFYIFVPIHSMKKYICLNQSQCCICA